jgi:hypothetical protein
VMILEVASVIADSSTSTGRSLLASARIRFTSSACQFLVILAKGNGADSSWYSTTSAQSRMCMQCSLQVEVGLSEYSR